MTPRSLLPHDGRTLLHEALLYDGDAEYDAVVGDPIRVALAHDLPVLVAVPPHRLDAVRAVVGRPSDDVLIVDMDETGRNPARAMSTAAEFFARRPGRRGLYLGEPLHPGRTPEQVAEVRINEALVDVAFAGAELTVLCPYDVSALDATALAVAADTHGCVSRCGCAAENRPHDAAAALAEAMAAPLDPAPADAAELRFRDSLHDVRELVRRIAEPLLGGRAQDLVLAASEVAANTIRHARCDGLLRVWGRPDGVVCEVSDDGRLHDLGAGRRMPDLESDSGRGLWMTVRLCDLTQIRTSADGTTVRLSMSL